VAHVSKNSTNNFLSPSQQTPVIALQAEICILIFSRVAMTVVGTQVIFVSTMGLNDKTKFHHR
jgi:hypothetical protein